MIDETPDAPQPEKKVYRKTPPATPAVQAWLDGEQSREQLGTADEQETAELWARINSEAENLRRRHTPIHVQSRILSSLPDIPAVKDPEPEERQLKPAVLAVGAIAILAVGALIGFMIVR
jgi:hypothetical protein